MVHEYFKKEFDDFKILVQINPASLRALELTVESTGQVSKRKLQFDTDIYEDLSVDGFERSSPLEFNLYLKGLTKK